MRCSDQTTGDKSGDSLHKLPATPTALLKCYCDFLYRSNSLIAELKQLLNIWEKSVFHQTARGKGKPFLTYSTPEEAFKATFGNSSLYLVGKINARFKPDELKTIDLSLLKHSISWKRIYLGSTLQHKTLAVILFFSPNPRVLHIQNDLCLYSFYKGMDQIFIWLYMLTKDEVTFTQLKQKCLVLILEWSVIASIRLY